MTASPARRTFAPDGPRGAGLNPRTELEAAPRGYPPITGGTCPGTQSIWIRQGLSSEVFSWTYNARSYSLKTK